MKGMLSADDVASVIIARSGEWMDAMRLQKLLYYTQAWHLAVTDEPLFGEQIKAWKDGPVVPQVWHSRREKGSRRPAVQEVESVELDELASNLVDLVLGSYGSMSGEELSALTHVEQPWLDARGDLPADAEGRVVIPADSMADYYRASRKLGGRTASDLAVGGVHLRAPRAVPPVDVDAILQSLSEEWHEPGDNPWGGASLEIGDEYDADGIVREPGRAYTDS
ncbi:putative phage-associated protein [Actinosynnema pretiosum]|nr:putative phage-associated protein [Actinosynnema pretiosum]